MIYNTDTGHITYLPLASKKRSFVIIIIQ